MSSDKIRLNDGVEQIFNRVSYGDILADVPATDRLPDVNRGSWYCPVAGPMDARRAITLARQHNLTRVYDLGAGACQFAVALDRAGFDVIAYETLGDIADAGLRRLPENDVTVRKRDYRAEWPDIREQPALFVALGKLNTVPESSVPNGVVVDGMEVPPP